MQLWGNHRPCWIPVFHGGCDTVTYAPAQSPLPIVSKPNELQVPHGELWWNLTLVCPWDLARKGWVDSAWPPLVSIQGENSHNTGSLTEVGAHKFD